MPNHPLRRRVAAALPLLCLGLAACSGTSLQMVTATGETLKLRQWRMGDREAFDDRTELPGGIVIASSGVGEDHSTQTRHIGRGVSTVTGLIGLAYSQAAASAAEAAKHKATEETARHLASQTAATQQAGIAATASTIPAVNVETHDAELVGAVGSALRP